MNLYSLSLATSKFLLQVAAMLAIALTVLLTTPRLEQPPTSDLIEMRDARSFRVV